MSRWHRVLGLPSRDFQRAFAGVSLCYGGKIFEVLEDGLYVFHLGRMEGALKVTHDEFLQSWQNTVVETMKNRADFFGRDLSAWTFEEDFIIPGQEVEKMQQSWDAAFGAADPFSRKTALTLMVHAQELKPGVVTVRKTDDDGWLFRVNSKNISYNNAQWTVDGVGREPKAAFTEVSPLLLEARSADDIQSGMRAQQRAEKYVNKALAWDFPAGSPSPLNWDGVAFATLALPEAFSAQEAKSGLAQAY